MIPRKTLDIGWNDLFYGLSCFLRPINRQATLRRIEEFWSPNDPSLVCLSLRSGFDHVLKALDLPPGSEVLMSAVSVRPMAKIIEHHGLVPVPVDVDIDTLAVRPEELRRVLSPKSKVLVIAQLFGTRNSQEQILQIVRQHGLVTIEDGAQTYTGDSYHGDPEFDVSMVSFGPIKTASTVVGGILRFRDPSLRDKVKNVQSEYPVHDRRNMLKRLFKFMSLKLLSNRICFNLVIALCQRFGRSRKDMVNRSVRNFPASGFLPKTRQQPRTEYLALLERRLRKFDGLSVKRRVAAAQYAIELLGDEVRRPGAHATYQSHWAFPILVPRPNKLMEYLWERGFDATTAPSSVCSVDAPPSRPECVPVAAQWLMDHALYIPVHERMPKHAIERLVATIHEFQRAQEANQEFPRQSDSYAA